MMGEFFISFIQAWQASMLNNYDDKYTNTLIIINYNINHYQQVLGCKLFELLIENNKIIN